jgi:hypothetical protein
VAWATWTIEIARRICSSKRIFASDQEGERHDKARTHLSLGKDASISRQSSGFDWIIAEPGTGDLRHRYARI